MLQSYKCSCGSFIFCAVAFAGSVLNAKTLPFFLLSGFRMRQRHVLMESTGPMGRCPHLAESVPCEDPMCHRWLASEGICIADHGKCGLGHRILKAVCQNERGGRW